MPKDFDQQRDQGRREFWESHLEQWKQSGLSQLTYCRQHHLNSHRFYYWRRWILKKQTNVSFLPIKLSANPMSHPQAVRVLMPNGCSIEIVYAIRNAASLAIAQVRGITKLNGHLRSRNKQGGQQPALLVY